MCGTMTHASEVWSCVRCARHGHGGAPIQTAKFSHDGKYCLTGGNDKSVVLWNPFRDADAAQLAGAPAPKSSDPTASAPSALLVQRYSGQHGGEIVDLVIARDGSRFASAGGQDKCAIVWDVTSGNVIRKIFGHDGRLTSCAWNDYSGPGGEANVLATAAAEYSHVLLPTLSRIKYAGMVFSSTKYHIASADQLHRRKEPFGHSVHRPRSVP